MKVIYCAGEQGRVVLDILLASDEDNDVAFVDDDESLHQESIEDIPVIGDGSTLAEYSPLDAQCLIAFGDEPGIRLKIAKRVSNMGFDFFNAVHPSATVSQSSVLGQGVTINGQSYIGPKVQVADHVLVDSSVSISHDCNIGEGSTLTPGSTLAGGVSLGTDVYVGPSATIIEDISVGDNVVIGAGAVVTENIQEDSTVVGVPAKPIDS